MAKKETQIAAAPKVTTLGNPFTGSWKDSTGAEIPMGSLVATKDGTLTGTVVSRWTAVKEGVRIPFVSVEPSLDATGVAAVVGGRSRKTVGIAATDLVRIPEGGARPVAMPRKRRSGQSAETVTA